MKIKTLPAVRPFATFRGAVAPLALLIITFLPMAVYGVAQGYLTDDPALRVGMAVTYSGPAGEASSRVERATPAAINRLAGVVVDQAKEAILIASQDDEVFVESAGEVLGYVSDINGAIASGDVLSLSPLKGILMRAEPDSPGIAVATEAFSAQQAETVEIEEATDRREVKVGMISIDLNYKQQATRVLSPVAVLEDVSSSLVKKEVGGVQMALAFSIFLLVMVFEGVLVYGTVTSSLISIGRNPLAREQIQHGLLRVVGLGLVILLFGFAAIYITLWV